MSDAPTSYAALPPVQIRTTAVTAGAGGYLYLFADYVSDCINAGHVLAPSKALVVMTLAALVPAAHLVVRIVLFKLKSFDQGDVQP